MLLHYGSVGEVICQQGSGVLLKGVFKDSLQLSYSYQFFVTWWCQRWWCCDCGTQNTQETCYFFLLAWYHTGLDLVLNCCQVVALIYLCCSRQCLLWLGAILALSYRGVVLALPKPSKSTISHHGLFHGVLAVYRVITVTNFDSRVCFCLSRVRVKLSVLLK